MARGWMRRERTCLGLPPFVASCLQSCLQSCLLGLAWGLFWFLDWSHFLSGLFLYYLLQQQAWQAWQAKQEARNKSFLVQMSKPSQGRSPQQQQLFARACKLCKASCELEEETSSAEERKNQKIQFKLKIHLASPILAILFYKALHLVLHLFDSHKQNQSLHQSTKRPGN